MNRIYRIINRLNLLFEIINIIRLKQHTKNILDNVNDLELDYMEHMINEIWYIYFFLGC